MSKPIRMILEPRSASATVISNMMAMLNLQKRRCVLSVTGTNLAAGRKGCSVVKAPD